MREFVGSKPQNGAVALVRTGEDIDGMSATDEEYLQIVLDAIRVRAPYKRKQTLYLDGRISLEKISDKGNCDVGLS